MADIETNTMLDDKIAGLIDNSRYYYVGEDFTVINMEDMLSFAPFLINPLNELMVKYLTHVASKCDEEDTVPFDYARGQLEDKVLEEYHEVVSTGMNKEQSEDEKQVVFHALFPCGSKYNQLMTFPESCTDDYIDQKYKEWCLETIKPDWEYKK